MAEAPDLENGPETAAERLRLELDQAHRTAGILARCLVEGRSVGEVDPPRVGAASDDVDVNQDPDPDREHRHHVAVALPVAFEDAVKSLACRFEVDEDTVYSVAATIIGRWHNREHRRRRERLRSPGSAASPFPAG